MFKKTVLRRTIIGPVGDEMKKQEETLREQANKLVAFANGFARASLGLPDSDVVSKTVALAGKMRAEAESIAKQRLGHIVLEEPWKSKIAALKERPAIYDDVPGFMTGAGVVDRVKAMVAKGDISWVHVRAVKAAFGVSHTVELSVVRLREYLIAMKAVVIARKAGKAEVTKLYADRFALRAENERLQKEVNTLRGNTAKGWFFESNPFGVASWVAVRTPHDLYIENTNLKKQINALKADKSIAGVLETNLQKEIDQLRNEVGNLLRQRDIGRSAAEIGTEMHEIIQASRQNERDSIVANMERKAGERFAMAESYRMKRNLRESLRHRAGCYSLRDHAKMIREGKV